LLRLRKHHFPPMNRIRLLSHIIWLDVPYIVGPYTEHGKCWCHLAEPPWWHCWWHLRRMKMGMKDLTDTFWRLPLEQRDTGNSWHDFEGTVFPHFFHKSRHCTFRNETFLEDVFSNKILCLWQDSKAKYLNLNDGCKWRKNKNKLLFSSHF
jgi:hypothetical protein